MKLKRWWKNGTERNGTEVNRNEMKGKRHKVSPWKYGTQRKCEKRRFTHISMLLVTFRQNQNQNPNEWRAIEPLQKQKPKKTTRKFQTDQSLNPIYIHGIVESSREKKEQPAVKWQFFVLLFPLISQKNFSHQQPRKVAQLNAINGQSSCEQCIFSTNIYALKWFNIETKPSQAQVEPHQATVKINRDFDMKLKCSFAICEIPRKIHYLSRTFYMYYAPKLHWSGLDWIGLSVRQ